MGRKKSLEYHFVCKGCKGFFLRKGCQQIYCTPCSYKSSKEKANTPKPLQKKVCENCKLNYETNYKTQKFCSDHCKLENKTKEANKAWLTKEEKPKKRRDSDRVAYSFFKIKNQGWLNKFKVCRG